MEKPKLPYDEEKRLKVLRSLNILDTKHEERFDRLTRMAKRMFDVPIASVSLVDENREWFKSCIGLSMKEAHRDISFCGHVILEDEILIIPDATLDSRFSDNPLVVKEPQVRFYVGCPLIVNGYKLGTLCIVDQKPRKFSQEDASILKDLAAMVESELYAMQIATHDELTGILNRRGFLSLAKNALNLSIRAQLTTTLVYFDLDHFKSINDNFGHAIGDEVLMSFTNILNKNLQSSDIFSRLSGDEFVVLFNNTNQEDALKLVEKFKVQLKQFYQDRESQFDVLFSFGSVEFDSTKHSSIQELLSEADDKMYSWKNAAKAI